jgi:hypothetical protein
MSNVDKDTVVNWDANEYVQHEKNAGWYIGFVIVIIALSALAIFLKWWTFLVLIILSGISLILYTVRPPRKLHYSLSKKGLSDGEKLYNFEDFKSFGILQDDTHFAIVLIPRKRFSPAVTVYFPEKQGEEIVDMFGLRLPMEEVKLDMIDKLVRLLRI